MAGSVQRMRRTGTGWLLAPGAAVGAHLDAWAAKHAADAGSWRRIYGKLRPKRSPWALLVYQAESGLTVQVRLTEPGDDTTVWDTRVAARPLGGLEILPCAADPELPGLAEVLESLDGGRVVRYHPGNRCVVHGWSAGDARYVKVLSTEVDHQAEAFARWQASTSGELSFAVAEPHGWDARLRASWYGVVPGQLGLIDFDRFAFGEPEFDLATFLVELRAFKDLPVDELRTALLVGFRSVAGGMDEERLALYVEHKRLAKVARLASSLSPDGQDRAAGLLDDLQSSVAGLEARQHSAAVPVHRGEHR